MSQKTPNPPPQIPRGLVKSRPSASHRTLHGLHAHLDDWSDTQSSMSRGTPILPLQKSRRLVYRYVCCWGCSMNCGCWFCCRVWGGWDVIPTLAGFHLESDILPVSRPEAPELRTASWALWCLKRASASHIRRSKSFIMYSAHSFGYAWPQFRISSLVSWTLL